MNREEFKKLIESIGFEYKGFYYIYKEYRIDLYRNIYGFHNGSKWRIYDYNDSKQLKKLTRNVKLKQILK